MSIDAGLSLLALIPVALFTSLAVGGLAFMLLSLWSARDFVRCMRHRGATPDFSPDVSILKPVKGVEPRMDAGFRSHCEQLYPGSLEILFGVTSLKDPAVQHIETLQAQYPRIDIRIVECRERLGASGKVSNLVQMLREARYEHVVINDSDIHVSPLYIRNVVQGLGDPGVGLVTAPYIGVTAHEPAGRTIWGKLEALGISCDFLPGVLTSRKLEGGIRYGLGSTLATTKTILTRMGGLDMLANYLADDYELGQRISRAGYAVQLCGEIVQTGVPAYSFKEFWEHQARWARTVRDARKLGYLGLGITYGVPWALFTVLASGCALWSFTLLAFLLLARVAVALTIGVGILRDEQVLRDLWLLPLRDCFSLFIWAWSYAGDSIVWRGERFLLRDGRISRA